MDPAGTARRHGSTFGAPRSHYMEDRGTSWETIKAVTGVSAVTALICCAPEGTRTPNLLIRRPRIRSTSSQPRSNNLYAPDFRYSDLILTLVKVLLAIVPSCETHTDNCHPRENHPRGRAPDHSTTKP